MNRMNKRTLRKHIAKARSVFNKTLAVKMALLLLFNTIAPNFSWALTGGPSQPEVQSFEPVSTTEMVDPFSGDFTYNIPLLDVDGYPINISYHSGVGMDDEASWVGLGWNINAGVINRTMRGIPDDFNGDEIVKEYKRKDNITFGGTVGAKIKLFGLPVKASPPGGGGGSVSLGFSLGVNYNNYRGFGTEIGLTPSISSAKTSKYPKTFSLGMTSGSEEGLDISPNMSFSKVVDETSSSSISDGTTTTKGGLKSLGIGFTYNSRQGLKNVSISAERKYEKTVETVDVESGNTTGIEGGSFTAGARGSFNIGMPSYTPSMNMSMKNWSISGTFSTGGELFGIFGSPYISGFYSRQQLATDEVKSKAYGYMNLGNSISDENAMLDFNRENDGPYNKNTSAIAISNLTYDAYAVSGQGIGGSYRPFRNDVGYVYDNTTETKSNGQTIGFELGAGGIAHANADLAVNWAHSESGVWKDKNQAGQSLKYTNSSANNMSSTNNVGDYEAYYFREANEKNIETDQMVYQLGGFEPVRIKLKDGGRFNTASLPYYERSANASMPITTNRKTGRQKRNQIITPITRQNVSDGGGISNAASHAFTVPSHHIDEISTLGSDGRRYIYGVAAYNTKQEEMTFAIGNKVGGGGGSFGTCSDGLVTYGSNDNTKNNDKGIDNLYNNIIMPPYAHSYLLTSVLSPDYIDADNVKGPSEGDIGYYTKFNYMKRDNYKWRTPMGNMKASYSPGLRTDNTDDKANIIYGEKEVYFLSSIETKNYIALFITENRQDGFGVTGRNGAIDSDTSKALKRLKKIVLYSMPDYKANGVNATPIKEVNFEYDYSLCPGVPNNTSGGGKLTLKKIFFTYQGSNKMRFSPYEFTYTDSKTYDNPGYNITCYDRWGNYKLNPNTVTCSALSQDISTADDPYVPQGKNGSGVLLETEFIQAWTLKQIKLPSGGTIKIEFESDDYSYVQDKPVMQMFKVVGSNDSGGDTGPYTSTVTPVSISSGNTEPTQNKSIIVETDPDSPNATKEDYLGADTYINFKVLAHMDDASNDLYDYVTGWAKVNVSSSNIFTHTDGKKYLRLKFSPASLKDNDGSPDYNPICKAAIQFGRLQLGNLIYDATSPDVNGSFGASVVAALVNMIDGFKNPNKVVWDKGKCREILTNKSWIRLYKPSKNKAGGGLRVKKIETNDVWSTMTSGQMGSFTYGQQFEYKLADGKTSSGVATYEPQMGGEENPFRRPVFNNNKEQYFLAPDDEFYQEEPIGESFFPSPSVGYSRVTVKNIDRTNVTKHATGKVVHEFYTAKDFPTIVKRTEIDNKRFMIPPLNIMPLLKLGTIDQITISQGFSIETNDMHGKPKKQMVYQENQNDPITSVEYVYKSEGASNNTFRLKNDVTVIEKSGNIKTAQVGVFYDMVNDFREQKSNAQSASVNLNLDVFVVGIIPAGIPTIIPSYSYEKTQFRSASTTKLIQRFGILEKTIAKDLGSVVETNNLAYDAETGAVLLTQTTTDFNDKVYSLTIPAHWYYDGMGPAYKNIGLQVNNLVLSSSGKGIVNFANSIFAEGDELVISGTGRCWVTDVGPNYIVVVDKNGNPVTGTKNLKIVRSGRRNMQEVPIATITTLSNPLTTIAANNYTNVLQAAAMDFSGDWRTYCDCYEGGTLPQTSNPYVLGVKGNWKMNKSWLHLSPRAQSSYDNNTNIRKDGVFTSFNPFYKLQSGKWVKDEQNWTYTSQVTEFSPHGQEVENKDALSRYSAAQFGFNQALPTGVAANSSYREIGTDAFEDYGFAACADNHFKFPSNSTISTSHFHTGKKSVKVSSGTPVTLSRQITPACKTNGCNLLLTVTNVNSTTTTVAASTGTGIYTFTTEIVSGEPGVSLSSDTVTLIGTDYTIKVMVTDSKGCTSIETITR